MSKELEALRNFISECENDWKTQPKRWVDRAINSNVSKYMDSLKNVLNELERLKKIEKLLDKIKDIINRPDDGIVVELTNIHELMLEESKRYAEIEKLIKEGNKMRKFELINNTEPVKLMAEVGSTCVEIEDSPFLSFIKDFDETKNDFLSVLFTDESGYDYDQMVHISQLKEIE